MIEQTISHYRIVKKLGAGGMGEVYLAEDTTLNRRVALKFLPAEYTRNEERLRRFKQEAKSASALNHPNILTIHEVGEADGYHFIATEFIDGETLRAALRRAGKMKTSEALNVAAQAASALAAAHEAGLVHRDIKPENTMLRRDGYVKVLDFGLAKLTEKADSQTVDSDAPTRPLAHTQTGAIVGTVQYMSPEQARGLTVDARTDIWSLGCVLYEMIAGRAPFAGETVTDMLVAIVEKEPPPLKHLTSEQIPVELDWIITKTLRKNPDERYQTSKELLVDLQRLRQKLEIEAHLEHSAPPEASSEAETANVAARSTAKRTGQLPHFLSARRTFLSAAVLTALVLGALAYVWRWRQTSVEPQAEIKSLAVLPLKSLDEGENYLGLGIADAVIRRISQTGELTVRPTSAVRRYLNEETDALTAARQLNADAVLEGSVQRTDDRLRVGVNLLRTADGASLWADNFDMRMTDIFTIQDKVAQQVASRLRLRLDPSQQARLTKRYTSNPEAYEYYLKGRAAFEQSTIAIGNLQPTEASIGYFKKAIAIDPKYALAYAALAGSYVQNANFNDPDNPAWVELMQQALAQAESLDPQLAEIHAVRFEYFFSKYGGWNLAQAAREARQALALNPSVGHMELGTIYDHLGLDEATGLREFQRALEIDPTNTAVQWRLVDSYKLYGKFDESNELNLRYFGVPYAPALIVKGQFDEAESLLEESVKKSPGNLVDRSWLALVLALKGKRQDAEAAIPVILQQARNNRAYHHVTYNIACIYALTGKTSESIKWLRTTADTGMPNYPLFERDPFLNRIRQAPEFIQFMAGMKAQHERYRREFA